MVGLAEAVTERAEVDRLEQLGLCSLVPGADPYWIRIHSTVVSDRRIASTARTS